MWQVAAAGDRACVTDHGGRDDDGPTGVERQHSAAVRIIGANSPVIVVRVRCGVNARVRLEPNGIVWRDHPSGRGCCGIDAADVFDERRILEELDDEELDSEPSEGVETVAEERREKVGIEMLTVIA